VPYHTRVIALLDGAPRLAARTVGSEPQSNFWEHVIS
jgi:hypothetical protein